MNDSVSKNQRDESIVACYYGKIAAFVHRRISTWQDGEDIVQDVFSNLAKADQLALPIDEALPWLYRVARNLMTDFWRKKKGLLFSDTENDDFQEIAEIMASEKNDEPETAYLQEIFWTEFRTALAELPPEQREVFERTEFGDETYRKISNETGVNVNTLLSRKRYATQHLRERLKDVRDRILGEDY